MRTECIMTLVSPLDPFPNREGGVSLVVIEALGRATAIAESHPFPVREGAGS
jgi:hypothetical protein